MGREEEYEALRKKARALRYKKPVCSSMSLWEINAETERMSEVAYEVQWFVENDENLVAALNGDEDDAYEFKMAFTDLEKMAGKKKFAEIMEGLVAKPPGKPTFVPESDRRKAIKVEPRMERTDAADDFADMED